MADNSVEIGFNANRARVDPNGSQQTVPEYRAIDYEQITVATTSIGFTASKIAALALFGPLGRAVCRLETAEIRYLYDPNPVANAISTTVGTPMEINDIFTLQGIFDLQNFRAIRTGGTSGKLNVTYERLVQ